MKGKEIHPALAGAIITLVVLAVVYFIYNGTSQHLASFDHAKMREMAGKAGMRVPNGEASSSNSATNATH